jgi:DNA polymerase III subunit delta'
MLKTLEEPAPYAHLILLTDRLAEVLPTITSRCQLVRFEAPSVEVVAAQVEGLGVPADRAMACARLTLGDAQRARELASEEGSSLRAEAEQFARAALAREVSSKTPWTPLLSAVRARGDVTRLELEARAASELELYPRKERKRIETEWTERVRRARRRAETSTLDLALQLVSLWFSDLACLAWGADDLVRNVDRLSELASDRGVDPQRLRAAIDLVEDTRVRFQLNVSEELACEALAYRLEHVLTS